MNSVSDGRCGVVRAGRSSFFYAAGPMIDRPYIIADGGLELDRWLKPVPRGSPKTALARALMWGGYTHRLKGHHTAQYAQ
ncbi:hypothetical protein RERY_66150 [Rhodococcus erythropolis]|nr:hypothetical protein RERY_66150 [Rhodococcus erythropolis]